MIKFFYPGNTGKGSRTTNAGIGKEAVGSKTLQPAAIC